MLARVHARVRAWFRGLLVEHTSPPRLAAAVFVGAIVGCSPLLGLHLPICIGIAWLLRLNQVAVYAAANVSVPPLAPLLGFLSVQAGERILRGRWLPLSLAHVPKNPWGAAADFFVDWLVGGVVVGAAIGAVLAASVFAVASLRARRASADPVRAAILAASRRYRPAPRPMRFYAFFKYRLDPCYRAIAPLLPPGALLVDLGTGLGMLPVVVALLGDGRRALGVDWDAAKLAAGRVAAAGLDGVELVEGDVRAFAIPACDVITLVDVLHYYDADAQRELLERCARALRPGGLLLVREGDAARRAGARWTRGVEAAAVRTGWNRGERRTAFRDAEALRSDLERLGLEVSIAPVSGRLHPGNVLIRAEVRAPTGTPLREST